MIPQIFLIVITAAIFVLRITALTFNNEDGCLKALDLISSPATLHGLLYWGGWYECFSAAG